MTKPAEPQQIRGHHLLCVQGFQGYGYSPEFVANLARIVGRLKAHPDTKIEIVAHCDAICSACPHRQGEDCCKHPDSAARVANHDQRVLARLGLETGARLAIGEVFALASARLSTRAAAGEVCGECGWQEQCLWYASRSRA